MKAFVRDCRTIVVLLMPLLVSNAMSVSNQQDLSFRRTSGDSTPMVGFEVFTSTSKSFKDLIKEHQNQDIGFNSNSMANDPLTFWGKTTPYVTYGTVSSKKFLTSIA